MKRAIRHNLRRQGFTLIEASMVTIIIGVGVLAMMQLLAAGTQANSASAELTRGLNLANNVRELMQTLEFKDPAPSVAKSVDGAGGTTPFNYVHDFHNATISPPVDARRKRLTEFKEWEQRVLVENVDPNLITATVPGNTPMARVTITVRRNNREVCSISFLAVQIEQ